MAKLYYKHGTMGSGKSLDLIRCYHNYIEKGMKVYCLKPYIDTRSNKIESRVGEEIDCIPIKENDDILSLFFSIKIGILDINAILIDESQFLTKEQVEQLYRITQDLNIPVICYGLKNNFQSELFEGSKRLLELADDIAEIKSICWCGKKSTQNARVINGEMVTDGIEVQIGGNESYIPLCTKHYIERKINR